MAPQVPRKRWAPEPAGPSVAPRLPWCPPAWSSWSGEQAWGGRVNLGVQIPISWGTLGPVPDSRGFCPAGAHPVPPALCASDHGQIPAGPLGLLCPIGAMGPLTSPEPPGLKQNPQGGGIQMTSPVFIFLLEEKAFKISFVSNSPFWLFLSNV